MTDGEAFSGITGSGNDFQEVVALCDRLGPYCLIGGLAVNYSFASLPDLVRAKIWAWSDPARRLSKRKKDELDLIRIAERYPEWKAALPEPIRVQLG